MGKTEALRQLVTAQLRTVQGPVYHRIAPADAEYPYKTYELSPSFPDCCLVEFEFTVDLWDRSAEWKRIEELAADIEDLFNGTNLPQETIFPTFYRESRTPLTDPDKSLQHIQQRFYVHLYEKEE